MSPMINLAALFLPILTGLPQQGDTLQTVAEQSGFKATARHGDVVALCKETGSKIPKRAVQRARALGRGTAAADVDPGRPAGSQRRRGRSVRKARSCWRSATFTPGKCVARRRCRCWRGRSWVRTRPRLAQGPGDRPGADLQRRRQRASLEDEPPRDKTAPSKAWASEPMPAGST